MSSLAKAPWRGRIAASWLKIFIAVYSVCIIVGFCILVAAAMSA